MYSCEDGLYIWVGGVVEWFWGLVVSEKVGSWEKDYSNFWEEWVS